MGPFEMLSGKQRELLACFEALAPGEDGLPPPERVEALLESLRLHVRLTERHLQPLVVRVEGHERALQEAVVLLAMHELMAELEWFPWGCLEWQARLMALEDAAVAHIRSLELQLFPRLAAALDEGEQLDLVRGLAATREALWMEMRRARPLFQALDHADSCSCSSLN
ncbi:hemerythrin domain-containing protein [Archangium sp.]|uniref:hemerythrin domain-containing protein n=1 Tax=Archangium sp. TaxID=1872627 RepID=UPI002D711031|nr:hemerythrin domain-containing protein [Archangium sp.]HYO55455.1 hemerythrin domain-containing protein [Archangium sp.]